MREILFRGKRADNGEWVEGSLSTEYLKECGCVMISPTADTCYKVDPETVGQYTGLTDKNGKKIFEGDIVKSCDNHIYRIKWDNQRAMFYLRNDITHASADFYHYFASDLEIIGNITDNPELLKGGGSND